jgi:hypothetical protein
VQRPEVAAEKDFSRKVTTVYRIVYSRAPVAAEVELARAFLGGAVESPGWARYAQGLLMANEFAFVD